MNSVEFKRLFEAIAKQYSFARAYGGWFRESSENIVVLDLQKSNYDNHYELNIKIFIDGLFGKKYTLSKALVKTEIGDVLTRQPLEYNHFFDLDSILDFESRKNGIDNLFRAIVCPIVDHSFSKLGILTLAQQGTVYLLPAVRDELNDLSNQ